MAAPSRSAFAAAALILVSGCGGGTLPAASIGAAGLTGKLDVRFTIRVPHPSRQDRHVPRYISPSTQSIAISIAGSPGGTVAAKLNANLTPTSGGCAPSKGATVCQKSVALAPGTYKATVNTYDQQNEKGNILSSGESLPMTIVTGKSNEISLVLGGVPHSVAITGAALGVTGDQTTGLTLLGSRSLPITITVKDADNNTIVGSKSLSYKASITSTSDTGWVVQATPQPKTPNTLDLIPPGNDGSTATVKLAFNVSSTACAQTGAVCTFAFPVENHVQILAITNCEISCGGSGADNVVLYKANAPTYTSSSSSYGYVPFATISSGIVNPIAVTIDKSGTLFVANCRTSCGVGASGDDITVYQPPFTNSSSPSSTITNGVTDPTQLAFDSSGDLFVDDCLSCVAASSSSGVGDAVTVYSHANYGAAPTTISPAALVAGMALDPSDNLLIAACRLSCGLTGADAIFQYVPAYTGTATAITNGVFLTGNNGGGLASQFAFDASGNLWTLNCCAIAAPKYTAAKYAAPFNGGANPGTTISAGLNTPLSVAVDGSGNVFIASGPGTTDYVSEYTAPSYSGSGSKLFGGGEYQAYEMAFDGFGDLVMSDESSVQISAPPFIAMQQIAPYSSPNGNRPFALSP